MYKYQSNQIHFDDFNMPLGLSMDPNNRWVQKAKCIPWNTLEKKYASLFSESKTGNVAKPCRLVLGALIIQKIRNISDVETAYQIQESPYLQYFCGLPGYSEKLPFDPSTMTYFRKRLSEDFINEVNEILITHFFELVQYNKDLKAKSKLKKKSSSDDNLDDKNSTDSDANTSSNIETTEAPAKQEPPKNKGALLLDSSCAPQYIAYPTDLRLLDTARSILEKYIDHLHDIKDGKKPRTNRKVARKEYLKIITKKNKPIEEVRNAISKQLGYILADIKIINNYLNKGKELSERQLNQIDIIKKLYDQQLFMLENKTHKVDDRIVSLGQHWVRPIVRGKLRAKCEFGAQVCISNSNGAIRLEKASFKPYNEGTQLIEYCERYFSRHGYYPEKILADTIYRNRENLKYCKAHNIKMLGPRLGRPPKDSVLDKKQEKKDYKARIEIERNLSYAKGPCSMGNIKTRTEQTSKTSISLSILVMNILNFARVLYFFFLKYVEKDNFIDFRFWRGVNLKIYQFTLNSLLQKKRLFSSH